MQRSIVCSLSILLFVIFAVSAEQRQRPVVRVSLNVAAPQEIRGQITSYLTRELRKIDDVIVTDSKPFLSIRCVALKSYNRSGYNIGYTLAFATTSSMPATITMLVAGPKLTESDARYLSVLNTNQGVLVDFFVQECGPDDLQQICRALAAKIDGELIESARQFAQNYIDANAATASQDDLRAAPSVAPLPGFSIEAVEQQPMKPAETQAPSNSRVVVVTIPRKLELHLRSEHNSKSTLLASLHQGDRVFLEDERYQNNDPPVPITWQKVTTMKGQTGWVNAEYLSPAQ